MTANPQPTSLNETIGNAFREAATFAANDLVYLVPYSDEYFDDHLRLRLALYPSPTRLLTDTEYGRTCYREMQATDTHGITLMILDAAADEFVGEVMVHDFDAEPWEIGWDVLPEHQNKGYATAAASALVNKLASLPECPGVIARMDADNPASIRVARKLGGVPDGIGTTVIARALGEDGIEQFVREHSDLLTKEVHRIAGEFGVEPKELLSHVLVFRIV